MFAVAPCVWAIQQHAQTLNFRQKTFSFASNEIWESFRKNPLSTTLFRDEGEARKSIGLTCALLTNHHLTNIFTLGFLKFICIRISQIYLQSNFSNIFTFRFLKYIYNRVSPSIHNLTIYADITLMMMMRNGRRKGILGLKAL